MSVQDKISSLERFISENPAFQNVPAFTVAGRPTTPREALNYLRAGTYVSEVLQGLRSLGLDPPVWNLCEEFYRRLAAARPDRPIIAGLGFVAPMSPTVALDHVRTRDNIGKSLVDAYAGMLAFMRTRVR